MNWARTHQRSAVLLGLTLVVPVVLYLKVMGGLVALSMEYRGERERLEPRLARIQGLILERDLLEERSDAAMSSLRRLVYVGDDDPSALAATLQAEVRQLLARAGMAVSNSQVLPVRQRETYDEVAVKLVANGSLGALDDALRMLSAAEPRLLVESIDTYPARNRGGAAGDDPQVLTTVLQVKALRAVL